MILSIFPFLFIKKDLSIWKRERESAPVLVGEGQREMGRMKPK